LDAVRTVAVGEARARAAVELDRALERGGVEPAGAPRPAGRGAELLAALAQPLAHVVGELGREGAAADARAVGLGDAEHVVQVHRADARARGGGTGDA